MSDDELPPAPSPLPLVGVHVVGLLAHIVVGALAIGVWLMGPPVHPLMDAPFTTPRIWASALTGFATVCALFFSTIAAFAAFRSVTMFFRRANPNRQRAAMVAGGLIAHTIGCIAGIGGVAVGLGGTFAGEHSGPFDTVNERTLDAQTEP